MAQVRLTEFFSQRKKGASGPRKPAAGALSSPVHREFVRVIDEAAGPADRSPDPAEPHTPKRPSGQSPERESAAAEHSSAKRKRRVPAGAGEPAADTGARRGARKKLVLPGETGRPKTPLGGAQTQVLVTHERLTSRFGSRIMTHDLQRPVDRAQSSGLVDGLKPAAADLF